MSPNLPYSTTFEALAGLTGEYQALGIPGWSLRVRTVAFKHKDDWFNYATAGWMEEKTLALDKVTVMRECVALTDWCQPISRVLTPHELAAQLIHWRAALKVSFGLTFQANIQLNRDASDFRNKSWPGWWSQLYVQGEQTHYPLPDGPFFDPQERIFGQNVPGLAMQFLGAPKYANQLSPPNEYILRIPDRRVRISALRAQNNVLQLTVDNPSKEILYWSVVATPFAGDIFHKVVDIEDNAAEVELPFAVQRLETWVILEDGYMLDKYEETPHYSTWGADASLFNAPRKAQLEAVSQALAGGESDTVEFKPYILLKPRDKKAFEILRSVSGFANTGGGNIYIGVNDEGEPTGIESDLNRDYGREHRDASARQTAYEKDLRKLINEGTAPTLSLEILWHDIAHRPILQIRVPSSTIPVHLPETGELYRRAGATNKKWRAVDAMLTPREGQ